jgi:hypothetical protein
MNPRRWILPVLPLAVAAGLVQGCPSGKRKPDITYKVRDLTPEEREARASRMKGNVHQRDQLFRHIDGIRGGR